MPPSQQSEWPEHVNESIIFRTLDGKINDWNRGAENLYGWGKDDAVGRVSHELFKTKFPRALEEIEAELMLKGTWEGKLVHRTRDGGRIVVESRWILDRSAQPESVTEINAPCNTPTHTTGAGENEPRFGTDEAAALARGGGRSGRSKLINIIVLTGIVLLVLSIVMYGVFGHKLIKALYEGTVPLLNERWLMRSRGSTPLEYYYAAADALLVKWTLLLMSLVALSVFFVKNPLGGALATFSVTLTSLLLFCFLELFPSLIVPFRLDSLSPYYSYKAYYLPDEKLGWKIKPRIHLHSSNVQQGNYSWVYGINVAPMTMDWRTDQNGFRNGTLQSSYDAVVLGDSYMDYGESESDTFPKRLEKQLNGLTVLNLGSAGYGPFQYVEVLKEYGVPKRPKYALLAFYSGNDLGDIKKYLQWKAGGREPMYSSPDVTFFQAYREVLHDIGTIIKEMVLAATTRLLKEIGIIGGYQYVHANLAVLDLGHNSHHKILFVDRNETASPEEISNRDEWHHLRRTLSEFKEVCLRNGIKPIILHVPSATAIYAPYATSESGVAWRHVREQQSAATRNMERAFIRLTEDLNIETINLAPVFRQAAEKGQLVYYALDSHWNAEGRELAAAYVADVLRSKAFPAADNHAIRESNMLSTVGDSR